MSEPKDEAHPSTLDEEKCLHCVILAFLRRRSEAGHVLDFTIEVERIMAAIGEVIDMIDPKDRGTAITTAVDSLVRHARIKAVRLTSNQAETAMAQVEGDAMPPKAKH